MEKLASYDSSILRTTPVAKAGEGDAALSEAFGSVAKTSFDVAETVMREESNFNLMKAASESHDAYTKAQIEMESKPGLTPEILGNLDKTFAASSSYKMNKMDRARLDSLNSSLKDEASLKGAKYQIGVSNLAAAGLVYDTTTQQLKMLEQHAAVGNIDQAENTAQMIHDTSSDAAKLGIIPMNAYKSISQSVKEAVDGGIRFHNAFKEGMTAEDVHANNWSPLGTVNDPADLPSNYATKTISSYLNEHRTVENLDQALINSEIQAEEFSGDYWNMSSTAQQEYVQKFIGIRNAYGRIASNHDFQAMEARKFELENNKETLDTSEKFELKVYQKLERDLQNGVSFEKVMLGTSEGKAAYRQYHAEQAAKGYHGGADVPNSVLGDSYNKYLGTLINTALAQNMNPAYIKPISEQMITDMRGSFSAHGDPSVLVNNLRALNFSNRVYAPNQFENKAQRESVRLMSYGMENHMSPEFMATSVNALKSGNNFESLSKEEGVAKVSDNLIKEKLTAKLQNITSGMSYFQDGGDGKNGFMEYATKWVKQRSVEKNDLTMSDVDDTVNEFAKEAGKGYDIETSYNYSFNRTQHNLTSSEYSALAGYAISKANENFSRGLSKTEFEALQMKTNFVATFNPQGDVLVVDDAGNTLYKEHYTDSLLAHAVSSQKPLRPKDITGKQKEQLEDQRTKRRINQIVSE